MKVLIVEDEERLIKDISFVISVRYPESTIISAKKGAEGIEMIENETPDLVMAASSLPDTSALKLISKIRLFSDVPILVLTEGETDIERAMVLEAGADDYIPKPFSPIELIARVKALLRRTQGTGYKQDHIFSSGPLTINYGTREVTLDGKYVHLTPREYALLMELARNEGRVITHRALLEKVWGPEYATEHYFVKKYIYRLRSKLEAEPERPRMLLSERGVGYKFVKPV